MSTLYENAFAHAMELFRADYAAQGQEEQLARWFNMRYIGDDGDTIQVGVPSAFMWRMMMDKGFVSNFIKSLSSIIGKDIQLSPSFTGQQLSSSPSAPFSASSALSPSTQPQPTGEKQQSPVMAGAKGEEIPSRISPHSTLLPRFTFEQFVTGENSEYAYNVCKAAAREPGTKFNPILLYGGVGLGKTHLMQAIGNYIYRSRNGQVKIVCVSAEQFGTDYTTAMRMPRSPKTIDKFKDKYRNCDVLLLDDIHFLQGKDGMQDELFYTFNALRDKNRQLVFTCDRPIAQLQKMVDRLASRLSNGQCVDLRAPSYEVRRAILQRKIAAKNMGVPGTADSAHGQGIFVPQDVIDYIAHFIETNVRDLESALNKVTGYAEMTNRPCDIDLARHLLVDMKAPQNSAITIETIQKAVAAEYSVTVAELKGKKRDKRLAYPRQVACYLCRELTESAFSDIGREFGGRDHATIMHACDVIATELKLNADTEERITKLIENIRTGG